MISVIVCSRYGNLSPHFVENIKATIDHAFELVVIDNSFNKYSLTEAYNDGIKRSKGDLFCFIHEDVLIHSFGWGNVLEDIFRNAPKLGLLGIAGSKVKTRMPSAWWDCPNRYHVINLVQHFEDGTVVTRNEGFQKDTEVEVAVIDGVLMIMRNDPKIRFNEKLNGFHNYDLDLSLQHNVLGKRVAVTSQILIEHFSSGKIDKQWFLSSSKFHKISYKKLPIVIQPIPLDNYKEMEFTAGAEFVMKLLEHDLRKAAFIWWRKLLMTKFFAKFHFRFLMKILDNK